MGRRRKSRTVGVACIICHYKKASSMVDVSLLPTTHRGSGPWCDECARKDLKAQMGTNAMPRCMFRCCELPEEMAIAASPDARLPSCYLSRELRVTYPDLIVWQCPVPNCNGMKAIEPPVAKKPWWMWWRHVPATTKVHCDTCAVASCSSCGEIWNSKNDISHDRRSCASFDKAVTSVGVSQLERWARGPRWVPKRARRCPECRCMIEKVSGCDHMICPCGAIFSW